MRRGVETGGVVFRVSVKSTTNRWIGCHTPKNRIAEINGVWRLRVRRPRTDLRIVVSRPSARVSERHGETDRCPRHLVDPPACFFTRVMGLVCSNDCCLFRFACQRLSIFAPQRSCDRPIVTFVVGIWITRAPFPRFGHVQIRSALDFTFLLGVRGKRSATRR